MDNKNIFHSLNTKEYITVMPVTNFNFNLILIVLVFTGAQDFYDAFHSVYDLSYFETEKVSDHKNVI